MTMGKTWTNWAGNQRATPQTWVKPKSLGEIAAAVGEASAQGRKVKVIGSGHSFTGAAVAQGVLLDLSHMCRVVSGPNEDGVVEVEAGITLSALNEYLFLQGRALQNLGDISYQTVSGAISTGTHGTGVHIGGLAQQVVGLTLVDGQGNIVEINEEDALLHFVRVGVGALGVIGHVKIRTVPKFALHVEEKPMRLSFVLDNLEDLVSRNDHFEFFWIPHTKWALTKQNNRTDLPLAPIPSLKKWWQKSFMENTAFGMVCRLGKLFPALIPRLATALPGSGSTSYVDESFRVFASERKVKFVEMEYAIPYEHCRSAIEDMERVIFEKNYKVSFPVEVRFTAGDDNVLSTAHARQSAYIAVHMYKGCDYGPYFASVAEIMAKYEGRPHWGKMHFLSNEQLSRLYPRWAEFLAVRDKLDPQRTFHNDYLDQVFGK
ncbi:FAD-binding protein [bacterium]|nr:FAD-binding protein [bacterium]